MARFISDTNKVVMLSESGTYAVPDTTGKWIGQVQEHALEENENLLISRYLGNANRSYGKIDAGPQDVNGTLTYYPQDMNLMAHALGSVYQTVATNTTKNEAWAVNNNVWQNPFCSGTTKQTESTLPYSFTIEDSKTSAGTGKNFIRTVKGACINTATLTLTQGEKASCEVAYNAQHSIFSSGNTTSVTAYTNRPYLWSDASLTMVGSPISNAKEVSLEINNNLESPHYINGSRVIGASFQGNREITLSVTADASAERCQMLYDEYYKGGSEFNITLDLNADITATGSQHAIFYMSGCRIQSMDIPSPLEGVNEFSFEAITGSINMTDYTNKNVVGSYNLY